MLIFCFRLYVILDLILMQCAVLGCNIYFCHFVTRMKNWIRSMQVSWKRNGLQSSDYRKRFVHFIFNANPIKTHGGSLDSLTIHGLKCQILQFRNGTFPHYHNCNAKNVTIIHLDVCDDEFCLFWLLLGDGVRIKTE